MCPEFLKGIVVLLSHRHVKNCVPGILTTTFLLFCLAFHLLYFLCIFFVIFLLLQIHPCPPCHVQLVMSPCSSVFFLRQMNWGLPASHPGGRRHRRRLRRLHRRPYPELWPELRRGEALHRDGTSQAFCFKDSMGWLDGSLPPRQQIGPLPLTPTLKPTQNHIKKHFVLFHADIGQNS